MSVLAQGMVARGLLQALICYSLSLGCGHKTSLGVQGVPDARLAGPGAGFVGDPLAFDASASQPADSPIAKYRFVFGDGDSTEQPTAIVTDVFSQPGEYLVSVTVTDVAGDRASASSRVVVTVNQPPVAALMAPLSVLAGSTFQLDASGTTDPNDNISTYTFDFGDGTPTATQAEPTCSYSYAQRGAFTATVSVTDDHGAVGTAKTTIVSGFTLSRPIQLSDSKLISQWAQS